VSGYSHAAWLPTFSGAWIDGQGGDTVPLPFSCYRARW
jgi:hypothetical protein